MLEKTLIGRFESLGTFQILERKVLPKQGYVPIKVT
jgi:hypothetical protein